MNIIVTMKEERKCPRCKIGFYLNEIRVGRLFEYNKEQFMDDLWIFINLINQRRIKTDDCVQNQRIYYLFHYK